MRNPFPLVFVLAIEFCVINACALPRSLPVPNTSVLQTTERRAITTARDLYVARDGCWVSVSTSPTSKRDGQNDISYGDLGPLESNGTPGPSVDDLSDLRGVGSSGNDVFQIAPNILSSQESDILQSEIASPGDANFDFTTEKIYETLVDGGGTSGGSSDAQDGSFKITVKRPEMCESPYGLDVYTVHFMEQKNSDASAAQQHQSIIVSEFGTTNDIRYHVSGTTQGSRMKFSRDDWFSFVGRALNRWELRGFIVPLPGMKKTDALAIFEAVMATVERPVVGNFEGKNCQTWVEEVLEAEKDNCPVYVPVLKGST